jgi:hypothetical protein
MRSPFTAAGLRRLFAEERDDLLLLLQISIAVLLVWIVLLGWSLGSFISGGDALGLDLNLYLQFLREDGVWQNVVYRAGILGGANQHDVWGSNLFFLLTAKLGIGPRAAFNAFDLITQISVGFFGVRFLKPGHFLWNVPRALLFAFSPFVALRFAQGHYGLVMVMTAFSSSVLFLYGLKERRITLTLLAVYAAILMSSLGQQNYQFIFYGALFGAPFIAVAFWRGRPNRATIGRFSAFALFLAACVLLSAPRIISEVDYALGPDSNRVQSMSNVIYSYTTATATDWLSSLFWGLELVPTGRDPFLFHETNYPMGPLLLFPLLLLAKRRFALPTAALLSAALAVAFSMNLEPVSGWLADIAPPLKAFRVPERAMLPFLVLLPWIAMRGIDEAFPGDEGAMERRDLLRWSLPAFFAAALCVYKAPQLPREIAAWAAAACAVLSLVRPDTLRRLPRKQVLFCAALILAAAELAAFKERLKPFQTERQVFEPLDALRERVLSSAGEDALRPLTRSHFDYRVNAVTNKGGAMGISTIEGYTQPTRRFAQLLFALKGKPLNATAVNFQHFRVGTDFFKVFSQLYNIRHLFRQARPGFVALEDGFGEAWFSDEIVYDEEFPALARSLYAGLDRSKLNVVKADALTPRPGSLPAFSPRCAQAKIDSVETAHGGQRIAIATRPATDCPLTVSTNFVARVRAVATLASGETKELAPFPGYGALLSLIAPANAREIEIEFPPYEPAFGDALFWLGALMMIAAIFLAGKSRSAP